MRLSLLSCSFLATSLASFALGNEDCEEVVRFPITLTWEKRAPDGFERDMILMNGQFPGPTLTLTEGAEVEFTVINLLPFESTVHFHGIEQLNTPWSDGVPGVSQEPIQPGHTFTYTWKATQYGTYWYHGHYKGQLEDGLLGAINILPANGTVTPFDMISNVTQDLHRLQQAAADPEIVIISDWSHFTSEEMHDISVAANIDPLCGDSILVNGQGSVNCPGAEFLTSLVPPAILPILMGENLTDKGCIPLDNLIAQTTAPHDFSKVPPGVFEGCNATASNPALIKVDPHQGWASLNFISTANLQEVVVSIDNHPMWVYAVDGRYIVPQQVDAITFSHGSRYSVFVQLNQPAREYTIRFAGDGLNQKIFGTANLRYTGGPNTNIPNPSINYAGANTSESVRFLVDTSLEPFPPIAPAQTVDQTYILTLNRTNNIAWQWSVNDNQVYNESIDEQTPLLWDPTELANTNLTITTKNNTWVDLVIVSTDTGGLQPPHPIHKHSTKAFIIGYGQGEFNYTDVAEAMQYVPENFNLVNPPYRDGFYTLPAATSSVWMVVRYHVVNPGAFLLHCHINPHLTGGMAIAILDGIDTWPTVPEQYGPGGNGLYLR